MRTIILFIFSLYYCFGSHIDCTVYDGARNIWYDLSPLRRDNSDWIIGDTIDPFYLLNICGPTVTQLCGPSSSNCKVVNNAHTSLGNYRTQFLVPQPSGNYEYSVYAYYSEGINKHKYMIMFICDPFHGLGTPYGDDELIWWYTSAACPGLDCYDYIDCFNCTESKASCAWYPTSLSTGYCRPISYDAITGKSYITNQKWCYKPRDCFSYDSCNKCTQQVFESSLILNCRWCLDNHKCISQEDKCDNILGGQQFCVYYEH